MDIGCVRMTERHLHGDPPTADEVAAAQADIAAAVDRALAVVPGRGAATLVGLAGSVTTVVAIASGLPSYDPERIHHARMPRPGGRGDRRPAGEDRGRAAGDPGDAPRPGGRDRRRAPWCSRVIMERARIAEVVASEHDILDGIAWSLR